MRALSKSNFHNYLICPRDAWYRIHEPNNVKENLSYWQKENMAQGDVVEQVALRLFPDRIELATKGKDLAAITKEAMADPNAKVIYQPTFVTDEYMCRGDVLERAASGKWNLYEMKATNSLKDDDGPRDHINDLAFQCSVMRRCGFEVEKATLVHLNSKYVRHGELDPKALFEFADCTEKVNAKMQWVETKMDEAKKYLSQETVPEGGCDCLYYSRASHCATFPLSHSAIPAYSVHDISRISNAKLVPLMKSGIHDIADIADVEDYSEIQRNQIETYKHGVPIVDVEAIQSILDTYSYPLYFFDYETFGPALPLVDGFGPYEHMPIQFSLHSVASLNAEVKHEEFLLDHIADPSNTLAERLINAIDPKGTILAWNVSVEKRYTKAIGKRLPDYTIPLDRIVGQMKDLADIFTLQYYVHKDFRGKTGIEYIAKVLAPEITYDDMPYTGNDVGFAWKNFVINPAVPKEEQEKVYRLLIEYCRRDTFAMVKIWQVLKDLVAKGAASSGIASKAVVS